MRPCDARTPRAALAKIVPCTMEGHCTSEKPPFFGARPCSHVLAMAITSWGGLRR